MTALIGTFALLAVIIVISAMLLATFADRLSEQTGMGGSLTGLILLAGATSLPEFSIGFSAVRMQAADLTAGDVLGSSLVNLLILAILDLASRNPGRILTRTAAAHAMSATVAVILTALVLLGILLDAPFTFLRLGPVSWVILIVYAACARLLLVDQRASAAADKLTPHAETTGGTSVRGTLWQNAAGFCGAAVVIFFVAPYLAETAEKLATRTGLGVTFFGTLFVAMMTSLPEAVSTWASIRMGQHDMAIGNILGSNAFNMIILAFTDLATDSPVLSMVSDTHCITAACVIVTTGVAALTMLYRAEKRWWIIEPDAALVALLVIGSMVLAFVSRPH